MREALSKVDPRALIVLAVAALLLAGTWFGVWQPAQSRQERALAELTAAEDQLRAAEDLVAEMTELQLESAGDIAASLSGMEGAIPDGFDDLQVAQTVSRRVSQGGLRLLELTRLEERRIDDNITAVPYRISVSGTPEDIQGFLDSLPEQFDSPTTWQNILLESATSASLSETAEARLGATLDLWTFTAPRSVAEQSASQSEDEQGNGPEPPPDALPEAEPADQDAAEGSEETPESEE